MTTTAVRPIDHVLNALHYTGPRTQISYKCICPDHAYFDSLLAEASEDGFDLTTHRVAGFATGAVRNNVRMRVLVIGEQFTPTEKQPNIGPTLSLRDPVSGTGLLFLTTWHTVISVVGNPIELHVKWTPQSGERRAFLNIEAVENRRHLDVMYELIAVFDSLKAEGGRPQSAGYAKAFARLINGECKTYKEAFDKMIDDMDDSTEKALIQSSLEERQARFANFKSNMKRRSRKHGRKS